jgi:hypothetical protein
MAKQINPPGTDGIYITPSLEVFQPYSFSTADRDKRQLLMVFHLGARMPEHA